MINAEQFRALVVRPVLARMSELSGRDLKSPVAEELIMLTIAHESRGGEYLTQIPTGPARGVIQMEIATWLDFERVVLQGNPGMCRAVMEFASHGFSVAGSTEELARNNGFAVAVCRAQYWRFPAKLPTREQGFEGIYSYYKAHWNTRGGAATPEKVEADYRRWLGNHAWS